MFIYKIRNGNGKSLLSLDGLDFVVTKLLNSALVTVQTDIRFMFILACKDLALILKLIMDYAF